ERIIGRQRCSQDLALMSLRKVDLKSVPEDGGFFYSVCGLRLRANRRVDVFLPASAGRADVSLHLEGHSPSPFGELERKEWYRNPYTDESGQPLLRIWTLSGGDYFHLRHSNSVEFIFDRAGEHVWSFWPEHVDFPEMLNCLAG